jgi:hypothetical protein
MKPMKPIGYQFNGALMCPDCTAAAVETGELLRPSSKRKPRYFRHGRESIADDLVNTEGVAVNAALSIGYPDGFTCDTCGEVHP